MNNTPYRLYEITGGRPFVLVVGFYGKTNDEAFRTIKKLVENKYHLACVHADEVPPSGTNLLANIHLLIKQAELVIASPVPSEPHQPSSRIYYERIYYEIGYAVGVNKRPILVIESNKEPPTSLRGLEIIRFENHTRGQKEFSNNLSEQLHARLFSDIPLLRDMLEAPDPAPCIIFVNPKRSTSSMQIRTEGVRTTASLNLPCTFGDYLGIIGLFRAFDCILHGDRVELVSPHHPASFLFSYDANLFFIGSQKACEPVGDVLKTVQAKHWPQWSLEPDPDWRNMAGEKGDAPLALFKRNPNGVAAQLRAKHAEFCEKIWTEDYGLIVRAPHPLFKNRIVLVMAGLHSLGTGAACLGGTRPQLIKEIRTKLYECSGRRGVLEDKHCAFWVIVKGSVQPPNYVLDEKSVTVVNAGIYE